MQMNRMLEPEQIVWFMLVIFIVHEFEEIVMFIPWIEKNKTLIESKRINIAKNFVSTESFSLAVFEELLIMIAVIIYTSITQNYLVWYGFLFALTLHFIPHVLSILYYKKYVSGSITAIVFLAAGIAMLIYTVNIFAHTRIHIFLSCFICTIILYINLFVLYKLMPRFDKILNL